MLSFVLLSGNDHKSQLSLSAHVTVSWHPHWGLGTDRSRGVVESLRRVG
jgi:hypothetical protein